MGQLDDYAYGQSTDMSSLDPDMRDARINRMANNYDVSGITDRSQIINPYEILSGYHFGNSRRERAKYDEHLGMLQNIQGQQQASYDEWYNSPEQQNIRDRQAGLNPDLAGLSDTQAPQTQTSDISPYEGIPTNGEVATNVVSSIVGLVGAASSIASLPSTFASGNLAKAQTQSQVLANLSSFENLSGLEIASRLSDSVASAIELGESLDVGSWFNDDNNFNNIIEAYAPEDSILYRNSFANVRRRMQRNLGAAYENGKITADNATSFAGLVASGRYSPDIVAQVALTRPIATAKESLEEKLVAFESLLTDWNTQYQQGLDVDSAVDAANAKNEYDSAYYAEKDGELLAGLENFAAEVERLALQIKKDYKSNQWTIYKNDPNSDAGIGALYNLMSDVPKSFEDFFYSHAVHQMADLIESKGLSAELLNVIQASQASWAEANNLDSSGPVFGRIHYIVRSLSEVLGLTTRFGLSK